MSNHHIIKVFFGPLFKKNTYFSLGGAAGQSLKFKWPLIFFLLLNWKLTVFSFLTKFSANFKKVLYVKELKIYMYYVHM